MSTLQTDGLTQTKFISPRLRDDIVPRRRLLDALHTAIINHALTLVSAPAGYGKTTLLTSLAAAFPDVRVAWISLDEEDNDPARFLATLISALQRVNPSFGANLHALLVDLTNPANDARRMIGALINETLNQLGETWVVLDDLHLITEPAIFSALDYWLERLPPQMHLMMATRHDPPLVLARLRARGQLAKCACPTCVSRRTKRASFSTRSNFWVYHPMIWPNSKRVPKDGRLDYDGWLARSTICHRQPTVPPSSKTLRARIDTCLIF